MSLMELFEVARVSVRGEEYGFTATEVHVKKGMPIRIDGWGSINFCNALGQEWWFGPEGQPNTAARQDSLGYGVPGCRHAMLIGRIGRTVFPIGASRVFQAPASGMLGVGHNDTKTVKDNNGEFDVRVSIPVTALRARVGRPGGNRAAEIQFNLPWGISGGAQLNLPSWVNSPRPKFSFHAPPSHRANVSGGLFCAQIDLPIPFWNPKLCVHVTL